MAVYIIQHTFLCILYFINCFSGVYDQKNMSCIIINLQQLSISPILDMWHGGVFLLQNSPFSSTFFTNKFGTWITRLREVCFLAYFFSYWVTNLFSPLPYLLPEGQHNSKHCPSYTSWGVFTPLEAMYGNSGICPLPLSPLYFIHRGRGLNSVTLLIHLDRRLSALCSVLVWYRTQYAPVCNSIRVRDSVMPTVIFLEIFWTTGSDVTTFYQWSVWWLIQGILWCGGVFVYVPCHHVDAEDVEYKRTPRKEHGAISPAQPESCRSSIACCKAIYGEPIGYLHIE